MFHFGRQRGRGGGSSAKNAPCFYNFVVNELGKLLVVIGGIVVVFGIVLMIGGRLHLPIGRLPGDIVYRGRNTTVYFPIVTSILISIVLSVVLYLISRFSR